MGSVRIFQVYRLHNFRSAVLLAPLANNCLSFHSNTECKQSRGMSKSVGFAPFVWNIESSNRLTTKCHAVSSSRFYATSHNRTGSGGKTLYDALEVSPTANQLQIKEAYFRLSKVYHPDVNKSKDAAVKFNEISQAYEILGKPTTRRVYDKGILKANDPRSTRTGFRRAATDHQQAGFEYKDTHDTQTKRSTRQQYTGRTPIYDYDEWLRGRISQAGISMVYSRYGNGVQVNQSRSFFRKYDPDDDRNLRPKKDRMTLKEWGLMLFIIVASVGVFTAIAGLPKMPPLIEEEDSTKTGK